MSFGLMRSATSAGLGLSNECPRSAALRLCRHRSVRAGGLSRRFASRLILEDGLVVRSGVERLVSEWGNSVAGAALVLVGSGGQLRVAPALVPDERPSQ